jgi:hypothetical protein
MTFHYFSYVIHLARVRKQECQESLDLRRRRLRTLAPRGREMAEGYADVKEPGAEALPASTPAISRRSLNATSCPGRLPARRYMGDRGLKSWANACRQPHWGYAQIFFITTKNPRPNGHRPPQLFFPSIGVTYVGRNLQYRAFLDSHSCERLRAVEV